MRRNLDTNERDIIRFTEIHGEYTVYGIVMVLAARTLAKLGYIEMVTDAADESGIGSATVKRIDTKEAA